MKSLNTNHLDLRLQLNLNSNCSIPEPEPSARDICFNFKDDSLETTLSLKSYHSPYESLSRPTSPLSRSAIPQLSQSKSTPTTPLSPTNTIQPRHGCNLSVLSSPELDIPHHSHRSWTSSRSLRNLFKSHSASVSASAAGLTVPRPQSARLASDSHKPQSSFSSRSFRNLFSKVHQKMGSKSNRLSIAHEQCVSVPHMQHLTITSKWRPNLDFILDDEELLERLIKFMTKQYNEENVLFLEAIGRLEGDINELLMFDEDINPVTEEKINVEIAIIYATYIISDAHKQVNLSSKCFTDVMGYYHGEKYKQLTLKQKADMFIRCGIEISHLIQTSILSSFYQSNEFQYLAHTRNIFTNDHNVHKLFSPMRLSRVNVSDNVDYDSDDVAYDSECKTDVYFDCHSSIKWTEHNKYMICSKGIDKKTGCREWKVKILRTSQKRQEFGVVSTFDKNIRMNQFGICDTPMFGARVVYGYNKLIKNGTQHSFYYASYNKDNSVRCTKDLSLLKMHERTWRKGDVITVGIDLSKGIVKFHLNGNKVRKTISIERNTVYYPIILYSGKCEYQVIA